MLRSGTTIGRARNQFLYASNPSVEASIDNILLEMERLGSDFQSPSEAPPPEPPVEIVYLPSDSPDLENEKEDEDSEKK